ncbi:MAG: LEA type 2 family protein [Gemmatimonadaceae bacterium]
MRTTIGVGLLALLAACNAFRRDFKEPVVTFKEGRVLGLGVSGGSLEIVLDIYNPNGYRLDGSRLTYEVIVDSVKFADGEYNSRFQVEKGDTSEIRLPVSFTYAGIGVAGRQLMQTGSVEYRVKGDITVGTPLGNRTWPYDQRRRFSTLSGGR